ncbi:mRNA interferase [Actinomycetota bacterium]|nr:mRNA interferase [Actinomycetota bacterium]
MLFNQGDIITVDFNPTKGHEPQNLRPALVVSSNDFNIATSMTIVCPISSVESKFFLHEPVPVGSSVQGSIIMEQVRAIDLEARGAKKVGHIDTSELEPVLICLRSFF